MKGWFPRLALAALATAVLSATAFAGTVTYTIDPAHSEVAFKVRHILTKVPGRFNEFEGEIDFDKDDIEKSSVNVTIQAASIYTNQERRDNHLRSDDFFAAEEHPTLTFKSTKIRKGKDGKFEIDGDLTIRGVTKQVTLDAEFLGQATMGRESQVKNVAGFEASTNINRKDFGVSWNRTLDQGGLLVSEEVEIILNVEAFYMEPKS